MKSKSVAAGCAAILTLGVGASVFVGTGADASPHPSTRAAASGTEHFFISSINNREVAIAHGPVTGGGRDISKGDKDLLHLGGGTLTLIHPNSEAHYRQHVNPTTCYEVYRVTGKYTAGRGTGKYAGATGHGTYTAVGHAIAQRKASGACALRAQPRVQVFTVKASGPLTMS